MTPRRTIECPKLAHGVVTILLLSFLTARAAEVQDGSQTTQSHAETRQEAFRLINDAKFAQAVPLLEKLLVEDSKDAEAAFFLGLALEGLAYLESDPASRKQMRIRGYTYLRQAQALGFKNALLDQTLAMVKPDGSEPAATYSKNPEANDAMIEGERAFSSGDIDKALASYEHAISVDPHLYEAALYAGDMFYKYRNPDKAADWYAKAIAINPDREIAYRYWGDSLMQAGKWTEARDKYVEAYLADPYNRMTSQALNSWAAKAKTEIAPPKIAVPPNPADNDPAAAPSLRGPKPVTGVWTLYQMTRKNWADQKFHERFPDEKEYRHSLAEEADALTAVAKAASEPSGGAPDESHDDSLIALIHLYKAGMIEPYVLLFRADAGIARDYRAYRRANIDKLRRFVSQFVMH